MPLFAAQRVSIDVFNQILRPHSAATGAAPSNGLPGVVGHSFTLHTFPSSTVYQVSAL